MPNRYDYLSRAIQSTTQQMEKRKQQNLAELQAVYQDIVGERRYKEGMGLEREKFAASKKAQADTLALQKTQEDRLAAGQKFTQDFQTEGRTLEETEKANKKYMEGIIDYGMTDEAAREHSGYTGAPIDAAAIIKYQQDRKREELKMPYEIAEPYKELEAERTIRTEERKLDIANKAEVALQKTLRAENLAGFSDQDKAVINMAMKQLESGKRAGDDLVAIIAQLFGKEVPVVRDMFDSISDLYKNEIERSELEKKLEAAKTQSEITKNYAQAAAAGGADKNKNVAIKNVQTMYNDARKTAEKMVNDQISQMTKPIKGLSGDTVKWELLPNGYVREVETQRVYSITEMYKQAMQEMLRANPVFEESLGMLSPEERAGFDRLLAIDLERWQKGANAGTALLEEATAASKKTTTGSGAIPVPQVEPGTKKEDKPLFSKTEKNKKKSGKQVSPSITIY